MPLSPDRRRLYHHAVYLNNTAATLMARGDPHASLDALTGAVALMATVTSTAPCGEPQNVNVREAEKNLARVACTCPLLLPSRVSLAVRNFNLRSGIDTFRDVSWYGNAVKSGLVLRLDDLDMEFDDECIFELAPAIILSNFSLSHLAAVPLDLLDADFYDRILCFLSMATAIVETSTKPPEEISEARLLVGIVLWSNICFVLQTSSHERPLAMHKLQSLQQRARDYRYRDYCYLKVAPPMAAGAA